MSDNSGSEANPLISRLRNYWMQNETKISPGASIQQIESFEFQYQVEMPSDLRVYFMTIDGMESGTFDPDMFSFISLNSVKSIPEELAHFGGIPDYREIVRTLPDPNRWFVIVDYMICSAVYAIRLSTDTQDTPVLCIGDGTHHRVVAASFSDFIERYLANPFALLP